MEAEMVDRASLLLPGRQQELVTKVAAASRGPTILVLMCGGPVDVSFAENNPRIGAGPGTLVRLVASPLPT